uniref:Mitochondrial substrate carrier family protein ucpB n=1 Tax=Rhizophora mucronata TaxID=61149 RepID=A0A2P2IQB5_RHIMU
MRDGGGNRNREATGAEMIENLGGRGWPLLLLSNAVGGSWRRRRIS